MCVCQPGRTGAENQSGGLVGRSASRGWWQLGGLVFLESSGAGISGHREAEGEMSCCSFLLCYFVKGPRVPTCNGPLLS